MRHVGVADQTVAGHTIATDHGDDCRLGRQVVGSCHGEEYAIAIMTGSAGGMDLVVGCDHRHTGCRASGPGMAARAFGGGCHPGVMWHVGMADYPVAGHAISWHHVRYSCLGSRVVGGSYREKQTISGMTGGTGVMNLVVVRIDWNTAWRPSGLFMAE